MTITQEARRQARDGSHDKLPTAIGAAVGTCIENYDFLAFATASALYFNEVFFPSDDPLVGTLIAFATLGVGFAMRPLGGLIGGYLGDRVGRKPVLVGALIVMGLATFLIGVLPTYETVGILAPILLVTLRVVQGLAFGAEWGGAILMAYEHAPWRHRGRYSAIPTAGNPLGVFLANVVFLVAVQFDSDWAWRVPFLASAVLVIVGLIIRARLHESPEFEETKERGELRRNPVLSVIREDWRNLVRVIGLRLVESVGFYVVVTYSLTYVTANGLADRETALIGLCIGMALGVPMSIVWGSLTDRLGRKPVYLAGSILTILLAFPLFMLLNSGLVVLVVLFYVIGLPIIHDMLAGTQGAWFSEQFPPGTRSSGASIGYQFAAAISGFVPFIATALAASFGWGGVAALYAVAGVVGVVAVVATKETWGPAQRAEVDAFIDGGAPAVTTERS